MSPRAKCHPRSHLKSGLAEKCQGKMSQGKTSQGKMSPRAKRLRAECHPTVILKLVYFNHPQNHHHGHHHDRPEEDAHHPLALLVLEGLCRVEEEESIEGQQSKRAGGTIYHIYNFICFPSKLLTVFKTGPTWQKLAEQCSLQRGREAGKRPR